MLRFWAKASLGLGLGAMVGGNGLAQAEPPLIAETLQTETAKSPLDAALEEEVFDSPVVNAVGYYCPPRRFGLPPMMGDFFPGYSSGARQTTLLDRLLVVADDLDAPGTLPPGNQRLTISETGPVGIFRTSLNSVQELQALLRSGQMLPGATPVGSIDANATLTTALSISQIQALLSSTPGVAFDIIPLVSPPGSYQSAVTAALQTTAPGGFARFDASTSGALLQGGADTLNGGEDLDAFYFYDYILQVDIPTPSAGTGGVGRSRIAENGTVKPEDRIFFDYGYFDQVGFLEGDGLHRFTPGFEMTFLDGMTSLELRLPFASTLDSSIFEGGATSTDNTKFGNIALYLKAMLMQSEAWGVSGGLGVIFPTADGFDVSFTNGGTLVAIDNEAYHLQPFLGGYYAPDERFFTQGFVQLDFDTNGNPVALNPDGLGLRDAGTLNDSAFLFLDWSIGYWLIRGDNAPVLPVSSFHEEGRITQQYHQIGLAPTLELHYASALESAESVSAGSLQVGNFADDVDTLTMVVGTHLEIGENTHIGLGYATPLSGGSDEPFDGAFRLTVNQFFGRN